MKPTTLSTPYLCSRVVSTRQQVALLKLVKAKYALGHEGLPLVEAGRMCERGPTRERNEQGVQLAHVREQLRGHDAGEKLQQVSMQ